MGIPALLEAGRRSERSLRARIARIGRAVTVTDHIGQPASPAVLVAPLESTLMDAFEAVRTVLAVREYEERAIPPESVRRILEAAHLTASSRNGQPWHFVVVQDRTKIQRLASLATSGPYMAPAPLVVAVAIEKASPYGHSDAGRAIQSMVLTAWSEGIGSNWVGFDGTLDAIAPELGIPDDLTLIALVPFGYPARKLGKGKKNRKPFGEVVHRERFGTPFS